MIIFGWRTRLTVLWQGLFACPDERVLPAAPTPQPTATGFAQPTTHVLHDPRYAPVHQPAA